MYSIRTEFLTKQGWKFADGMNNLDDLATYADVGKKQGQIEWIPAKLADLQITKEKVEMRECQVAKAGKFCITIDHHIRFYHHSRGDKVSFQHTLAEVITKLEKIDFLPGYIPTTFNASAKKEDIVGDLATKFSAMFRSIQSITDEGYLVFAISRLLSKKEIVDFLLKAGVPLSNIKFTHNNTKVEARHWKMRDILQAIILTPYLLTSVVNDLLYKSSENNNCIRSLRTYCPNKATFIQLATAFGGRNSKIIFDPIQKGGGYVVTVEPKDGSVSFRNRVIVLPAWEVGVSTSIQHPITRYHGRIAAL